ncbi:ATP-dependent Clp protease adaptor ClpS [Mangrovimicrobium sediminis]|uniref:ATP-dependent Clp protease adaptor ClpS n=1 Tax=Mangrovimicrobium sediminis TaxID=2562682 RepID=A0A4Z0LTS9_9GAMM|nr:ATP-dependent Clp protease adaptor ClpS [Haliea sp. SAOS-164]TGD70682.1 ATP-dependent Clp protease adaptor ClpS [Haliea sp. SAOS-164]
MSFAAMQPMYFELDKELDSASKLDIDKKLKELFQLDEPGTFSVVLYNDPINGVDYVTGVIKDVFGYSTTKAIWLMLKAHFTGKSSLWSGAHNEAKERMAQIVARGPDPNMLHKGAEPLKVSVQKNG